MRYPLVHKGLHENIRVINEYVITLRSSRPVAIFVYAPPHTMSTVNIDRLFQGQGQRKLFLYFDSAAGSDILETTQRHDTAIVLFLGERRWLRISGPGLLRISSPLNFPDVTPELWAPSRHFPLAQQIAESQEKPLPVPESVLDDDIPIQSDTSGIFWVAMAILGGIVGILWLLS